MARARKNSYLVLSLVLVVALLLALTNPGLSDFKNWYQLQSEQSAKAGSSGVVGDLAGAFGKLTGAAVSNAYQRTNLGLCSLFRSHDNKGAVRSSYLGFFRTFVKIK
jgi:hypothetical protein